MMPTLFIIIPHVYRLIFRLAYNSTYKIKFGREIDVVETLKTTRLSITNGSGFSRWTPKCTPNTRHENKRDENGK